MVQVASDYAHHSKFMQHELDVAAAEQEKADHEEEENEAYGLYNSAAQRAKETPKTIDTAELYENIALQTGNKVTRPYEKHHQAWYDEVEKAADKLEDQMEDVEDE